MSDQATVSSLPSCDFCGMEGQQNDAAYDFRTSMGPWAHGCERHYKMHRATPELGTGNGQRLVLIGEKSS